jgi:hypothetical protein
MAWAHGSGRTGSPVSRDTAVVASTAVAGFACAVQTRTMRATHDDLGIPPFPAGLALRGHAFVTALARDHASPAALAVAWVGGVAGLATAWALTPPPRPIRELAAELMWVVMAATMARAFTEGIERNSADLEDWLAGEDSRRLAASAARGRRRAVAIAHEALADAEATYCASADGLEPELRTEARRRLDRCAALLADLEAEDTFDPTVVTAPVSARVEKGPGCRLTRARRRDGDRSGGGPRRPRSERGAPAVGR